MGYRIFYSYQSDIKSKLNRKFIREAINNAIEQITDFEIDPLVEGFYGISGNPPLPDTMLKQSRNSDIFIGDLTFTMSKIWYNPIDFVEGEKSNLIEIPKGDLKPAPNPNVLIETGYSWALKNYDRTILIMNEAFGHPSDLPVDTQNLRWPITYNLSEERYAIDAKREKEFEKLANSIKDAILTVINSDAEYQREKLNPILLRKHWSPRNFKGSYYLTSHNKIITTQLRTALKNPLNPQRIIGPKGSGKTRIVFELYNEIDKDLPFDPDFENMLYYNLETSNLGFIEDKILNLKHTNQRKILVIDNCSYLLHEKISNHILNDSTISLLTIDEKSEKNFGHFDLNDANSNEIIKKICYEYGIEQHTDQVLADSNSNIQEAINIAVTIKQTGKKILEAYPEKWDQILGVELLNIGALKVLEELSLYTFVGYSGAIKSHSDFIRKQVGLENEEVYIEVINGLEERNLIRKSGDYIILESFIEELAAQSIENLTKRNISEYIENIAKVGLSKQFGNRLIELGNQESKELIVDSIVGENGIATKYDFLNSDQGARIIMSLSEIAPVQTVKAITIALNEKSIDDLKGLVDGRRYLVWALERLCFREETFWDATNILYRLALAENEEISNNATAQFCQLFQVRLAGTEVSLSERLKLITKLFEEASGENEFQIITRAIDKGMMVEGWMRMGGAEKQAGKTLQDYWTDNNEEIKEYFGGLIKILERLGSDETYKVIVKRLNQHLQHGNKDAILGAVESFLNNRGEIDKNLHQQFTLILSKPEKYNESDIEIIKGLTKKYSKNTIEENLKIKVSEAPYNAVKTKTGEYENLAENTAREYVNELFETGNSEWFKEIEILLKGEQRQTFSFGHEWSKLKSKFDELIEIVINKLEAIPSQEQNNSLIEGYLSGTEDEPFIRTTIDKYLAIDEIKYHAFRMTRLLTVKIDDLEKLKPLVNQDPSYVLSFQYMHLEHLTSDEITSFLDWLSKFKPHGSWTANELIYDYLKKNEDKINELKEFIGYLLQIEGILCDESYNQLSFHYYKKLVEKLQSNGGLDPDLIQFISNEILLSTNQLNFNNEYELSQILAVLFDNYWEISWPIVSTSLVAKGFGGWYNLIRLLKDYKSFSEENLLAWMDKDPENYPQNVIHFVEFEIQHEDKIIWSPIVQEMINRYGGNKIFLGELSSVLHSWSAVGSAYPLLEGRKELIEQLLDHPNDSIMEFAQNEIKYFESRLKREGKFIQNINLEYN